MSYKKCSVIVVHTGCKIDNVSCIREYSAVDFTHCLSERYFDSYDDAIKNVLNVCKANHYQVPFYTAFGCRFYDILFVDTKNPQTVSKYAMPCE